MEWLKVSDAVFVLNNSPGSDEEIKIAKKLGLKIFKSLDDIPISTGDDSYV